MPAEASQAVTAVPILIEWLRDVSVAQTELVCPTCGDGATKTPVLRASWPALHDGLSFATLLRCGCCGCGFFHPAAPADYRDAPAGGEAALAFYLQQGAGLHGIATNLTALGRSSGTRLLEVGCGFGLGLDFARRSLGWDVVGLDPSPFAAEGRRQLGLPIEPRYLVADDPALAGQFDVVMASEVIEHVADPPAFARTLFSALRPGGTLVLTTPDVDAVGPGTPPGTLVPLLSIGYHLALQSAASVAGMLRAAGFVGVTVRRIGGASLVVQANRDPVREPGPVGDRHRYRRYLEAAAGAAERQGDLWFGLTARAFREAVVDSDRLTADKTWATFARACRGRFRFDPDAVMAKGRAGQNPTLEELVRREPLCLGPVLFHRAMHRMLQGQPRAAVEGVLIAASEACLRLRQALQQIGADDGDAEDIAWVAGVETIICAAERGAADCADRIVALGPAPGDAPDHPGGGRAAAFTRRVYVSLVNAGHLEQAGRLGHVVAAAEARATDFTQGRAVLADDELDTLYCAAVLELQVRGGSAERALVLLRLLERARAAACRAGKRGSAIGLTTPARQAEDLARSILAQGSATGAGDAGTGA